MAKDPFAVIDSELAPIRAAVKANVARRLKEGAHIGSARDGVVVVATVAAEGDCTTRVVKRYNKATARVTARQRHRETASV